MGRSARFYELAAFAQERAWKAPDIYNQLVWLDIAQQWKELAEFVNDEPNLQRMAEGSTSTRDKRLAKVHKSAHASVSSAHDGPGPGG
jgi:hypothetical protein